MKPRCLFLLIVSMIASTNIVYAFVVNPHGTTHRGMQETQSVIFMAKKKGKLSTGPGGFGAAKQAKETKIKPKQQWDRYLALKTETAVKVAVRRDGEDEWIEVGNVKSKGSEYTEMAVFRQKGLIAEHAARLFPLKVRTNDKVEWAFWDTEAENWRTLEKSVGDLPEGLEKEVGFEGKPDPSSGFYCMYNEGRLVQTDADINDVTRSGKRLE